MTGAGGTRTLAIAVAVGLVLAGGLPALAVPDDDRPVAPASSSRAARAAVAAMPRATAVNDRDGNKVFDDLDLAYMRAAPTERLPVIVSFVEGVATAGGTRLVEQRAPGAPRRHAFTIIPAYATDLTRAEAARVAQLPEVRQIELDRDGAPELDTATAVMGADAVVDEVGISGSLDGDVEVATSDDVGIAVLDTGIHPAHLDLEGKLVAWRDFGTNRPNPYDPNGHGTHVASIAAGWGRANQAHRGVAPGAALVGVKIDGGGNTTSNTIAAYQWIVANKDELGIRVATISFGFGIATDGTTALERTIDQAWDAGIVCTKSNGNSGPGHSTMTVPAAARGILAIGSILDPFGATSARGFRLSPWSSRGPTADGRVKPDLVAPGESIRAAQSGTTSGYVVLSGTSMAAPFAAGAAALLIAANPGLEPDAVREILFATAEDRGAEGPDNDFGHGRIQVWHAVAEALARDGGSAGASAPPAVPRQESRTATPTTGVYESTFTVADRGFPVAVTALGDLLVGAVQVFDPTGASVVGATSAINTAAGRQHAITFDPPLTGEYSLRIVVPPGSPLVVDLSHSTAS